MPTLVHITDERNVSAIQRAGIRPSKLRPVVYFMPATQNHLISHQWMRELRRSHVGWVTCLPTLYKLVHYRVGK